MNQRLCEFQGCRRLPEATHVPVIVVKLFVSAILASLTANVNLKAA
jgi:hypothetical protein